MEQKIKQRKVMPDLSGFTGTEGYNKLTTFYSVKFTDGWAFLAESVGCYWLADIIASVQHLPKVARNNAFLIWRIEVKNQEARVSAYTDCEENGSYSNKKKVYAQLISYTDFPEGLFEWYQEGDVVMFKGER